MMGTDELFIGKSGIENNPAIWILDSTKIQNYIESPRKFFFNHVIGLRGDTPNIHLEYGKAMHEGLEVLQLGGYSSDACGEASTKFLECFKEAFPNEAEWSIFDPKTPTRAIEALFEYAREYDFRDEKVLYTEIAGAMPISMEKSRAIHFKQDTILLKRDGFWSREHKTASRFGLTWEKQWHTKFQIGTYALALFILKDFLQENFGLHGIQGVEINGVAFQKKETKFLRVPIYRTEEQLDRYLGDANYWWDKIEEDFELLAETSPSDKIMRAFPCGGEGCTRFGCLYSELCSLWLNPLQHIERPPTGFKVEYWDPSRLEEKATNVLVGERLERR